METLTCCCGRYRVEQVVLARHGGPSRTYLRISMDGQASMSAAAALDLLSADAVLHHLDRLGHTLDPTPGAVCPARPDLPRGDD